MRGCWQLGLLLGLWLGWAAPSLAANPEFPGKTYGPFTLNAAGEDYPSATGVQVSDVDAACTTQIVVTTGTVSIDIEGQLQGATGWATLGTITTSHMDSLPGPIDFVRFHLTTCGSTCSAVATVRCRSGQ